MQKQDAPYEVSQQTRARTINISALGEEELLNVMQEYITNMTNFANDTRNVHKELQETLAKTSMQVTQLKKVRDNKARGLVSFRDTGTQTYVTTFVETGTQSPCRWGIDGSHYECQQQRRSECKGRTKTKGIAPKLTEVPDQLTAPPDQPESISWVKVTRRKRKPKTAGTQEDNGQPKKATSPKVRSHPPALLVKVSRDEYPALVKRIEEDFAARSDRR